MIGAVLSNAPASLLKGHGAVTHSQADEGRPSSGQDRLASNDSLAGPRASNLRTGSGPLLTPEALTALQEIADPQKTRDRNSSAEKTDAETNAQLQSETPSINPATKSGTDQTSSSQVEEDDADGDGLNEAEEKQVEKLKQRDREVRAHEQAHARVGGAYASAPSYTFQQGPDGKRYAVGGEVQIDTAKERTPEATIRKMQIVIRAATAPAEPSSQDLKVAQQARSQLSEAQADLRQQKADELNGGDEEADASEQPSSSAEEPGKAEAAQFSPSNDEAAGDDDTSTQNNPQKETAFSAYQSALDQSSDARSLFQALIA